MNLACFLQMSHINAGGKCCQQQMSFALDIAATEGICSLRSDNFMTFMADELSLNIDLALRHKFSILIGKNAEQ